MTPRPHDPQLVYVRERRTDRAAAFRQVKRHGVHPDPVEIPLEDRRHSIPPGWEAENEGLGLSKPPYLVHDAAEIGARCVVSAPLGGAQDRVEPLGVEIATIDLVATTLQSLDDDAMCRGGQLSASGCA